ncbi:MAG: tetratricopeptide repeat protein, partial [bacterium]
MGEAGKMAAGRRAHSLAFVGITISLLAAAPDSTSAQTDPACLAALADSASARLERGDIEGARSLYEQVLEAEPDHLEGLVGMGRVWLANRAGAERALEDLRKATAKHPTSPKAHYWRAMAHLRYVETDLGRDNAAFARKELETTLELDPSHGDARYQMARLLRKVYEDYTAAAEIFRQQVAANPGHLDARFELLKAEMDLGEWRRAIAAGEELLDRDPGYRGAYPYLAGAYWRNGQTEEAMGVFERYFGRIDERERDLYLDMGIILTPSEREEFASLDAEGRQAYWARYWRTRDPDPQTDVNERLLEHYIRIAYARIEFGKDVWPWDARGDFYVRYGEPGLRSGKGRLVAWEIVDSDAEFQARKSDLKRELGLSTMVSPSTPFHGAGFLPPAGIEKHRVVAIAESLRTIYFMEGRSPPPDQSFLEWVWDKASASAARREFRHAASATPERWVYEDMGLDVRFEDPVHNGAFVVADNESRALVERIESTIPTLSEEEEKIEVIDPMDSVVTFKGPEGKTRVEYAFALLPDEFGAFRSTTGTFATLDVEVALYTPQWKPVEEAVQP